MTNATSDPLRISGKVPDHFPFVTRFKRHSDACELRRLWNWLLRTLAYIALDRTAHDDERKARATNVVIYQR